MTEPLRLKFDGTISLPMLGGAIGLIIVGTLWVASVNNSIGSIRSDVQAIKQASQENNRILKAQQ